VLACPLQAALPAEGTQYRFIQMEEAPHDNRV
jgi:hypothetical protein